MIVDHKIPNGVNMKTVRLIKNTLEKIKEIKERNSVKGHMSKKHKILYQLNAINDSIAQTENKMFASGYYCTETRKQMCKAMNGTKESLKEVEHYFRCNKIGAYGKLREFIREQRLLISNVRNYSMGIIPWHIYVNKLNAMYREEAMQYKSIYARY